MRQKNDAIINRIEQMNARVASAKDADYYYYNQPVEEILGGSKVLVRGREMGMFASYSYLGLIGHPKIYLAAKDAVDKYGTGTHGVRSLAGSLDLHVELEERISNFKHTEDAVTFSSGYVTNLTVISTLLSKGD
ncbi:MAG: aminotransferase class I/II-fold pyridoxal phosphate-dependent enzyme, partial [Chloroflexota bacterium]